MKVTKYGHACAVVEHEGKQLVIDPGELSKDLPIADNVVAVVVTHRHFDHLSDELLQEIIRHNPAAKVLVPADTAAKIKHSQVVVVRHGEGESVGPFHLEFCGQQHAEIHSGAPTDQNIAVLVNGVFFHPGDSFTMPHVTPKLLALPVSGPWLKLGDAAQYVTDVRPEACFATHDALNSDAGNAVADGTLGQVCQKIGVTYHRLHSGDSLEI